MELRDLIVTPLVIMATLIAAYIIRPMVTDINTRRYFFPALILKMVGAIALGFIYQFYYNGGDTFNYHTHGSRHLWEAVMDDPFRGLRLIFGDKSQQFYKYTSRILFFSDPDSFFMIRITAFFDLFTFSSYTATAILFSIFGFCGMWLFFLSFYEMKPHLHAWFAVAAFFIPSVFFWGSGILKDTITMGCLGFATYSIKRLLIDKKMRFSLIFLLAISFYFLFEIKKYILMTFLPAAILWVYAENLVHIKSLVLKIMILPVVLVLIGLSGYFALIKISENDTQYSLDKIAITSKITAYDVGFYTGRDAGSGYSLGELDGTFSGMIKLTPLAINVSLFRPYLWEVKNPFMLLASLESLAFLCLSVYAIYRCRNRLFSSVFNPHVLFCMVFSITFAFAVGVSTFNFGTLVRYKIPMMPFFLVGLILMMDQANNDRKFKVLEETE